MLYTINLRQMQKCFQNLESYSREFCNSLERLSEVTMENIKDILKKISVHLVKSNSFKVILEDFYKTYHEIEDKNEIVMICNAFFEELKRSVNVVEEIKRFVFTDYFDKGMISFNETLLNSKKLTFNEFNKLYNEKILKFIKNDVDLSYIIEPRLKDHNYIISKLNEKFQNSCYQILEDFEINAQGMEMTIKKSNVLVKSLDKGDNSKKLKSFIERPSYLFRKFFKNKSVAIKQIITFESDVCFILLSNKELDATHILRFNPKFSTKEDLDVLPDIKDSDVRLAWGSSANKYIMFLNTQKLANHGSLKQNKYFERGISLPIYEKLNYIITSSYMKKSRKLFVINEEGKLFYKDMIADEGDLYLVRESSEESKQKKNNWLKPSSGSKFIDLNISNSEAIILLKSEVVIDCYDINFIRTHVIPLDSCVLDFKTLCFDNECFLIQLKENNIFSLNKIIVPIEETQIESNKSIIELIKGNPILDV